MEEGFVIAGVRRGNVDGRFGSVLDEQGSFLLIGSQRRGCNRSESK